MNDINFRREDADRLTRIETILSTHLEQENKDRALLLIDTTEIKSMLKIQNGRVGKLETYQNKQKGYIAASAAIISGIVIGGWELIKFTLGR